MTQSRRCCRGSPAGQRQTAARNPLIWWPRRLHRRGSRPARTPSAGRNPTRRQSRRCQIHHRALPAAQMCRRQTASWPARVPKVRQRARRPLQERWRMARRRRRTRPCRRRRRRWALQQELYCQRVWKARRLQYRTEMFWKGWEGAASALPQLWQSATSACCFCPEHHDAEHVRELRRNMAYQMAMVQRPERRHRMRGPCQKVTHSLRGLRRPPRRPQGPGRQSHLTNRQTGCQPARRLCITHAFISSDMDLAGVSDAQQHWSKLLQSQYVRATNLRMRVLQGLQVQPRRQNQHLRVQAEFTIQTINVQRLHSHLGIVCATWLSCCRQIICLIGLKADPKVYLCWRWCQMPRLQGRG